MESKSKKIDHRNQLVCYMNIKGIDDYIVKYQWNSSKNQYDIQSSEYNGFIREFNELQQQYKDIIRCPFKQTRKLKRDILFHSDWDDSDNDKEYDIKQILDKYASFKMKAKAKQMGKEQCIQQKKLLE